MQYTENANDEYVEKQPVVEDKKKPEDMTEEELEEFLNSIDPDSMGFSGSEEGVGN